MATAAAALTPPPVILAIREDVLKLAARALISEYIWSDLVWDAATEDIGSVVLRGVVSSAAVGFITEGVIGAMVVVGVDSIGAVVVTAVNSLSSVVTTLYSPPLLSSSSSSSLFSPLSRASISLVLSRSSPSSLL